MKLKYDNRSWHAWISVVLALPILIVAVTATFIAHTNALGLKEIEITPYVGWLPGYGEQAVKMERMEVYAALSTTDGSQWVGTKAGLYQMRDGQTRQVEALGGTHVRDLVETPAGLVAVAKNGVWLREGNQWQRTLKGDAWSGSGGRDGRLAVAVKERGVLVSADARTWQADTGVQQALASLPASAAQTKPVTLGNLVMDLHTGKAFFGKEWEWIWIDLIGFVMAFLGVTGVVMWWRGEKRKRELEAKLAAAEAQPARVDVNPTGATVPIAPAPATL